MSEPRAGFVLRGRNPDVLACIANLSNDEVFTPPALANRMLDTLAEGWAVDRDGANIWADPSVTFLDPVTKSGVFLREITTRLIDGLRHEIPDLEKRVNHVLVEQVFGIGITSLTAQMARRTIYCSKDAASKHSIAPSFGNANNANGNIWFQRVEHTWVSGPQWALGADERGNQVKKLNNSKCKYCGASQRTFDRGNGFESHAYAFIHTDDINARVAELFGGDMQFDIIIGNPPYQLTDGGGEGASAIPLYHEFVNQAKAIEPKQLVMIIPARWYSGGKGLNDFRDSMLSDGGLAEIHDYPETGLVFPGLNIRGGVCYFRWSQSHNGPASITNYSREREPSTAFRELLEPGVATFVRYNDAINILKKVRSQGEVTYDTRVQSRNPFGIPSNFTGFSTKRTAQTPVLLFRSRRGSSADKEVYISTDKIVSNIALKDKLKVLVSKASPGGDEYPHAVFSTPLIAPKNSVATETYLIVDFPASQAEAGNLLTYMRTRFFRFLVSLIKTTQNISKGSFAFVPVQDLSSAWTDELLYKKYGITDDEAVFIEQMVRPMVVTGDCPEG